MAGGGQTFIVPPEYYGVYGAGEAVKNRRQELQQNEDREFNKQIVERREGRDDEKVNLEKARFGEEQENNAIQRANLFLSRGDRDTAEKILRTAGVPLTDGRLAATLGETLDEEAKNAISTPADQRTDEQWGAYFRVNPHLQGMTPEQARQKAAQSMQLLGLDLSKALRDEQYAKQWEESLKKRGLSPGQIQAQKDLIGVARMKLENANIAADTALKGAQGEALKTQSKQTGANPVATAIAGEYAKQYAKFGVDPGLAFVAINGGDITPEQEKVLVDAHSKMMAEATASGDASQKLNALATIMKVPGISDATLALAQVQAINSMMGKDVAKLTPRQKFFGGTVHEVEVDMEAAASAVGAPPGTTAKMQEMIAGYKDLNTALADVNALQDSNPNKAIYRQLLEAEAQKRGVALTPSASPSEPEKGKPSAKPAPKAEDPKTAKKRQQLKENIGTFERARDRSTNETHKKNYQKKIDALKKDLEALGPEATADNDGFNLNAVVPE